MATSAVDDVRFLPASDQSLLVYFGERITLEANARVVKFLRLLEKKPIPVVRNLHPGYCSVLVKFDALRCTHADLELMLREYLARLESVRVSAPRVVEIPVCYGGEFGPDLGDVCAANKLTEAQAVALHTGGSYLVYFLGFVPGFAYLSRVVEEEQATTRTRANAKATAKPTAKSKGAGLKDSLPALQELAMARLPAPRRRVPAGSVGIAGNQTGVYPFATPGGWRLIGRTPLKMFCVTPAASSVLQIGDRVRFVAIPAERFAEMEKS
jgi:KipI family sensor histidine kinase inhibitor